MVRINAPHVSARVTNICVLVHKYNFIVFCCVCVCLGETSVVLQNTCRLLPSSLVSLTLHQFTHKRADPSIVAMLTAVKHSLHAHVNLNHHNYIPTLT